MNNGKISDSRTELDSTSAGNVTDKPVLKISPVASISSEDDVKTESENVELDVSDFQEIADEVKEIKIGNKSMFEKIGDLFDLKTKFLRTDLKSDNASVNSALNDINANIIDIKSDKENLKSDIETLRRDFEKSTHALRRDVNEIKSGNTSLTRISIV